MALSRKNYERVAEIIRVSRNIYPTNQGPSRWIQKELADYFASDNPNFDRGRFAAACEPKTGESNE